MLRKLMISLSVIMMANAPSPTKAVETQEDARATLAAVQKQFATMFPRTKVDAIKPSPWPDLFLVTSGKTTFLVDRKLEWLLVGDLYSLKNDNQPSVAQHSAANGPAETISWDSLPKHLAITYNPGGERAIAVFDDPDCPFCRQFHEQALPELLAHNIAVHVFLLPITKLHPQAYDKSVSIWCASEQTQTLDNAMKGSAVPSAPPCRHPLDDIAALAKRFQVTGTPTIILDTGERVVGARPAAHILRALESPSQSPPAINIPNQTRAKGH